MNISEDKIDDFVNGRLQEEEMNKISEMAKSDPDLTTAIEDAKITLAISNQLINDDIITMTNQWKENAKNEIANQPPETKFQNKKSLLRLILGIILIFITAIFIYTNFTHETTSKNSNNTTESINQDIKIDDSIENSETPIPTIPEEESEEKGLNSKDIKQNKQQSSQRKLIASRLMPPLQKESILRSASDKEKQLNISTIFELYNQKNLKGLETALAIQKENSAVQILTKELIARILFEKGDYQKAIIIFEELVNIDMPNREEYEFMLLLSYYIVQPLQTKKFSYLKSKIADDKDHTYHSEINQLI
ncbi:MAG: hypothetical protein IPM42_03440 [Saprospiraceae bacterium]|nr:hypothetical protein [Saprospiraceae bacterium]